MELATCCPLPRITDDPVQRNTGDVEHYKPLRVRNFGDRLLGEPQEDLWRYCAITGLSAGRS